jgi:cation diffusion facilitator family transporter
MPNTTAQADREKRRAALGSLLAALLLTTLKIVVGVFTNSLGVLSEAAHSGLDLVAAGLSLWAVRAAGQPADREHTYGHGKFENLSALAETLLLLCTCVWIVYEACRRLFLVAEHVAINASVWAFLVIALSIAVDFSRSRILRRTAQKYGSQALEADALHFSTDVWSSCVVLVGLLGILAARKFQIHRLELADSVAALGVAAIVILVTIKLGKRSIDDLLDRIPGDLQARVAAAARVEGVKEVTQVRVRRTGTTFFADVTLSVDHGALIEGAHAIANSAEDAVRAVLPEADVVIHVEPDCSTPEGATVTVRVLAARFGMGAHGIRFYESEGRRSAELHLEVSESLTLEEAHRKASAFEEALRAAIPDLGRVVTHLEPSGDRASTRQAQPAEQAMVRACLDEFLKSELLAIQPHDLRVQASGGELAVSLHCTLDSRMAITEAHDLTERLEAHLRKGVPNLGRVVIHVEPAGETAE